MPDILCGPGTPGTSAPLPGDHQDEARREAMISTFPVALRGATAPTPMWAHEHDVEPAALQQLRNIAALPWVHGVRVMPDVHLDVIWTFRQRSVYAC